MYRISYKYFFLKLMAWHCHKLTFILFNRANNMYYPLKVT